MHINWSHKYLKNNNNTVLSYHNWRKNENLKENWENNRKKKKKVVYTELALKRTYDNNHNGYFEPKISHIEKPKFCDQFYINILEIKIRGE